MDLAETDPVKRELQQQAIRLGQQEEQFGLLGACVNAMTERQDARLDTLEQQLSSVLTALHAMSPPTAVPATPQLPPRPEDTPFPRDTPPAACPPLSKPERFSGESERARVAFILTHMSGRASAWATAEWVRQSPVCASYAAFSKALKSIFQRGRPGREAAQSLLRLQQGQRSVTDFAIEFRRLAAESEWPTSALVDVFSLGLADKVRRLMIPLKTPDSLDELVATAVEVETRLFDWETDRLRQQGWRSSAYNGSGHGRHQITAAPIPIIDAVSISREDEPMQLGGSRLTQAERDRRFRLHLCLYCGEADHRLNRCPHRPARHRSQASPPRTRAPPTRHTQATHAPATAPAPLPPSTEKGQLRAGPAKIKSVVDWPTPTTRKHLQRFLGFANFYRRFIRNFSQVAEPLTKLTSTKIPFLWTSETQRSFEKLKLLFTSAPVLIHPNVSTQFFVEVDASDSGVGAVLSQRSTSDQRLHPCAFFSRRLTPAERNYDIELRPEVLNWAHNSKIACHPGITRTTYLLAQRFWWTTLRTDVTEYVAACSTCARNKASHRAPAGLLRPLPIPSRPWSHVALDFITGLPPSNGNTVILTVVDRFSKMAHFIPLPKLPSALETAELLTRHVFRLHGIPVDVVSDRGPQFSSAVWKAFCNSLGASPSLSSGYHPQTNGQTERTNQDLEAAIRCVCHQQPASWALSLSWIEYAHNTLISSATGMSPFHSAYGYQPPVFPSLESEVAVPSVAVHLRRARLAWQNTRSALALTSERNQPPPQHSSGLQAWSEGMAVIS
ncbi:uncharacterized protein [Nerophis lumbriciformis]|uniref:uncharacterized protein n=1 Tax=Nerophis lumbriciformis TaxID=546530 RepID=UPI002ADF2806|nr:uncharacterized protein LOC133576772 [Nerophis lumbriciformis]